MTDAGVQWVVGSCHSPALLNLDLSNTSLTGNCFLRRLPHLHTLKLDCCSSLTGKINIFYINLEQTYQFNNLYETYHKNLLIMTYVVACYNIHKNEFGRNILI